MLAALGTALWLGILTSVSPCPLATNVAAMGFIGRRTARVFGIASAYTNITTVSPTAATEGAYPPNQRSAR